MYEAIETGVRRIGDEDALIVKEKTRVREDDPRRVGAEDWFREIEDYPEVEQATAGPGEKRAGRRQVAA
jgi:hypothetical protein